MSDNKTNDGGPAFPAEHANTNESRNGMTLRDWFAGQALAILADHTYQNTPANSAIYAYAVADAMLAVRARQPQGDSSSGATGGREGGAS